MCFRDPPLRVAAKPGQGTDVNISNEVSEVDDVSYVEGKVREK